MVTGRIADMDYDPFDIAQCRDPYPDYRALRDQDSVHWSPESRVFCVTRFDEAEAMFRQPELFSSRIGFNLLIQDSWETIGPRDVLEMARFVYRARVNPLVLRTAPNTIISSDPPSHGPMRLTVNRGFTPRRIAEWEDRVREISQECVRGAESEDGFDVVDKLAAPLPMRIIAEMLGVDVDRIADFRRWSTGVIDAISGSGRAKSPGYALRMAGELFQYMRSVVDARRKRPTDDLISVLVDPNQGVAMTTQEVVFFALVVLIAGNETTMNTVGSAVELLMRRRDVLEEVADDPSLIPNLVEEIIRMESPFRWMPRTALQDTMIRGTKIPEGADLLIMIGAANRDERRFENPDHFDLHRDTAGHLGFGFGIHFCLGASLARLEARVVLETLVPLLRDRELRPGGATQTDSFFTRGYSRMEVTRIAESEALGANAA
jgi:cytochrome P450